MQYDFPGNIRELENVIEYAFVMCRGDMIKTKHLSRDLQNGAIRRAAGENRSLAPLQLEQAERDAIVAALESHWGHRGKTAEYLKIDKSTLWRKMKKYGIQ
jgi:DNA-binding NtrC family response regulator